MSAKARERAEAAHVRAECALRDHPTLKRWIRQLPSGRLAIDRTKMRAEANLDGKYLIATSDPDITAEDAALGYNNLLEAERGFRDLKFELLLRPIFHRLEHCIRAHVLICWLALLIIRIAERETGQSWRQIRRETGRLKQVTLAGPAGTIIQTTHCGPTRRPSTRHYPSRRRRACRYSTPPEQDQRTARDVWAHASPGPPAFPQLNAQTCGHM
jgi:hypothetical protein